MIINHVWSVAAYLCDYTIIAVCYVASYAFGFGIGSVIYGVMA